MRGMLMGQEFKNAAGFSSKMAENKVTNLLSTSDMARAAG